MDVFFLLFPDVWSRWQLSRSKTKHWIILRIFTLYSCFYLLNRRLEVFPSLLTSWFTGNQTKIKHPTPEYQSSKSALGKQSSIKCIKWIETRYKRVPESPACEVPGACALFSSLSLFTYCFNSWADRDLGAGHCGKMSPSPNRPFNSLTTVWFKALLKE